MSKDEIISEVARPILRIIGIIQVIFLLSLIISPFIWIWIEWNIAWKTGLTGLIGCILTYAIHKIVSEAIVEAVNECIKELKKTEPKFTKDEEYTGNGTKSYFRVSFSPKYGFKEKIENLKRQ